MNYLRAINKFWEIADSCEGLTANDRVLYFSILRYCNAIGWTNPFGMDWIVAMQYSGLSRNTYYKCMQRLNDYGFIKYEKGRKNVSASTVTIIKFDNSTVNGINNSVEHSIKNSSNNSVVHLIKPLNEETINLLNSKTKSVELDKQVLEIIKENERLKRENKKLKSSDSDAVKTIKDTCLTFDQFWDLYDKKVGSKKKLQPKFERLTEGVREKIKAHLPAYKSSQPDKKYRKNPDTYLNNEGWSDEIITSKPIFNSQSGQNLSRQQQNEKNLTSHKQAFMQEMAEKYGKHG